MIFKVDGREFSIIKGSDGRDGLGGVYVELNEIISGEEKWLFEIFYFDEIQRKECSFETGDIPFEALKKLIEVADEWLEPKND